MQAEWIMVVMMNQNKYFMSLGDIDMTRKKYLIMTVKDMKNLKKIVRAFT